MGALFSFVAKMGSCSQKTKLIIHWYYDRKWLVIKWRALSIPMGMNLECVPLERSVNLSCYWQTVCIHKMNNASNVSFVHRNHLTHFSVQTMFNWNIHFSKLSSPINYLFSCFFYFSSIFLRRYVLKVIRWAIIIVQISVRIKTFRTVGFIVFW